MNKVVLALGASLGALTLAACNVQQEEAVAVETDTAVPAESTDVGPTAIEATALVEGAEVQADVPAMTDMEAPIEGATNSAD